MAKKKVIADFDITFPTDEELKESSVLWLDAIGPTLIDNWPKDILDLSAPTIFFDLPKEHVYDMYDDFDSMVRYAEPVSIELDKVLGFKRKFFRLNSRSPKDSMYPFTNLITCSGKEILQTLSQSERMLDDLSYFYHSTATPKICLRDPMLFEQGVDEFRVFVMENKVLAVAEYLNQYSDTVWVKPSKDYDSDLRSHIDRFMYDTVIPRLHLETVVVDVCFTYNHEWRVIELNPYGLSDPVGAESYEKIEEGIPSIARLHMDGVRVNKTIGHNHKNIVRYNGFKFPKKPSN